MSWAKQWPDAPFIRYKTFFNTEMLMVNNVAAFKEVMQTKAYTFQRSPLFRQLLGDILGDGLLLSEDVTHRRLRKRLNCG